MIVQVPSRGASAAALAIACLASLTDAAVAQFGVDLVQNGSFEVFTPNASGAVVVENNDGSVATRAVLEDWAVSLGDVTLTPYAGIQAPVVGIPTGGGAYGLFGSRVDRSDVAQVIDVAFAAADIDAGRSGVTLTCSIGSYVGGLFPDTQDDIATVVVAFAGAGGAVGSLGEFRLIGPSVPADVGLPDIEIGNFMAEQARRAGVPVGTRRIDLIIELDRDDDARPDAFNNASVDVIDLRIVRCIADVSNDGQVDSGDLQVFVTAFLAADAGVADLTGDGQVDSGDLSVFITAFLIGC